MGMFKRANKADSAAQAGERADLSVLALQGEDMIEQLGRAHMSWGLGSADRWDLDQTTGIITWTFPDKTATASAQILGSFRSRISTDLGTCGSNRVPGRVIFRRYAHEGRASW
ncbi:DUF6882 domain-containing protein [Streptomyces sp. NPDC059378]|uniref:DUF6882 domain-containing protein n=1 Tax=Streptomyces sp. NPDC059378 TaxID=3346815 RepID=UPI00367751E0